MGWRLEELWRRGWRSYGREGLAVLWQEQGWMSMLECSEAFFTLVPILATHVFLIRNVCSSSGRRVRSIQTEGVSTAAYDPRKLKSKAIQSTSFPRFGIKGGKQGVKGNRGKGEQEKPFIQEGQPSQTYGQELTCEKGAESRIDITSQHITQPHSRRKPKHRIEP